MGRLFRWFGLAILVSTIASVLGALWAKSRFVSQGTPESDEVDLVAIMQPLVFASTATEFRGGTLLCWMGSMDVDLREATLDPAGAHLYVRLIQGGGRIFVPDDWQVELKLMPLLGGAGDGRTHVERSDDAPRLVIDGFALMGGFAILSERGPDEVAPTPTVLEEPAADVEAVLEPDVQEAPLESVMAEAEPSPV